MSKLIEHLQTFNRKERFILLEEALGSCTFRLHDDFRKKLAKCLSLKFEIPACAYVAMDYHIGWIQMAVHLKDREIPNSPIPIKGVEGINDNQQDVDLLVAFTADSATHLVLVEAKADTPWDYAQLKSKVERLQSISPSNTLELHFVLVSPNSIGKSQHVCISEWPRWMKNRDGGINHMCLELAPCLRKITRCDGEDDKSKNKDGKYYRFDRVSSRSAN